MLSIKFILLITCGIGWTIAYIDCIRIGLKDKTYAMPFWALALNFSWETYNTLQGYIHYDFHSTTIINLIWIVFDIGIFYTYFKYGNRELKMNPRVFYSTPILVLLLFYAVNHAFGLQFGLLKGAIYVAFLDNLMMSLLFIKLLKRRGNLKGQSFVIAISKCIGTVASASLVGITGINSAGGPMLSILILGILILTVDLRYIYLMYRIKKESTISLTNLPL